VHGGLVSDTDAGRAKIRFVTEGEASLHACVLSGLASEVLSVRTLFGYSALSVKTLLTLSRNNPKMDSSSPTREAERSISAPTPSKALNHSQWKKSPHPTVSSPDPSSSLGALETFSKIN